MTTSLVEEGRLNLLTFSRDLADVPGGRCVEDETFLLADTGSNTGLNRIIIKRRPRRPITRGSRPTDRSFPASSVSFSRHMSARVPQRGAGLLLRGETDSIWGDVSLADDGPGRDDQTVSRGAGGLPYGASVAVGRTVEDWVGLLAESFGSGLEPVHRPPRVPAGLPLPAHRVGARRDPVSRRDTRVHGGRLSKPRRGMSRGSTGSPRQGLGGVGGSPRPCSWDSSTCIKTNLFISSPRRQVCRSTHHSDLK